MISDRFGGMWRNNRLNIPPFLASAIQARLEALGYYSMACEQTPPKGIAGGQSAPATYEYFARLGLMSCVRPMSVYLDPEGHHEAPRSILRRCLHRGRLLILDLPSGPGTTGLGLIGTACELRRNQSSFPYDLDVEVLAIDFSASALEEYQHLLDSCTSALSSQNISVNLSTAHLDIADTAAMAAAVNDWLRSRESSADQILFLSTAITDFGSSPDGKEAVMNAFQTISLRLATNERQGRYHVWLEPDKKESTKLLDYVLGKLRLSKALKCLSNYAFWHAFQATERHCRVQSKYRVIQNPPGLDVP